jgi:formamidopyrimidine-DNA glycosylase
MPELGEVEYFRKQWGKGLNKKVLAAELNADKKIFRGTDAPALREALRGAKLIGSEAHGKQMLFRFSKGGWLGIHLGMTGKLRVGAAGAARLKHDHLVLRQEGQSLILSDPRQFGRVLFHHGKAAPDWWRDRPVEILSAQFTLKMTGQFLLRHGRAPIKAVLLLQSGFPGIGNWMADEILWQAKIHPRRPAGGMRPEEVRRLFVKTKHICRVALRIVGGHDGDLPETWLFGRRWGRGGRCPADGAALERATVGGRTTCWCPCCQRAGEEFN